MGSDFSADDIMVLNSTGTYLVPLDVHSATRMDFAPIYLQKPWSRN